MYVALQPRHAGNNAPVTSLMTVNSLHQENLRLFPILQTKKLIISAFNIFSEINKAIRACVLISTHSFVSIMI